MRAISDNEIVGGAISKDVITRHLQVFILESTLIGLAGTMLITLDG